MDETNKKPSVDLVVMRPDDGIYGGYHSAAAVIDLPLPLRLENIMLA